MTAVAQDHLFFNFTQSCTLVFSVHIWCCTPKGNTSQISNCSHQFSKKAEGGRRKHLSHPCCLTQGNADLGIHALHCMESSTKGWCSHMCLSRYGVWQPGRQTTTQTQVPTCTCLRAKEGILHKSYTKLCLPVIRYAETRWNCQILSLGSQHYTKHQRFCYSALSRWKRNILVRT